MTKAVFVALLALCTSSAWADPVIPVATPAPPPQITVTLTPFQLQALQFFVNVGVKAVGVEQGSQVPRAAAELTDILTEAGKQKPK